MSTDSNLTIAASTTVGAVTSNVMNTNDPSSVMGTDPKRIIVALCTFLCVYVF